jgi:hypothetical protein
MRGCGEHAAAAALRCDMPPAWSAAEHAQLLLRLTAATTAVLKHAVALKLGVQLPAPRSCWICSQLMPLMLQAAGLTDRDQTPAGNMSALSSGCCIADVDFCFHRRAVSAATAVILHPDACPLLLSTVPMLLLLLLLVLSAQAHVQVEVTAVLAILGADLHGPARASTQIGSTERLATCLKPTC